MPPPDGKPFSRREFARRAVVGAASATLLPLPNLLPDATTPGPAQASANAPKLSPQSQAEADSRFEAILQQYPDRFSETQKGELKRLCVFAQPPLDRIRAYTVGNGDLPALYLKPLVDREKKPPASSSMKPATAGEPRTPGRP